MVIQVSKVTNIFICIYFFYFSWTCSLISSLPNDKKSVLKVCLPSMKQDNRILLHFLPHILLHALLESDKMTSDKSLKEIQTITSSFTEQKPLDPKAFNVSFSACNYSLNTICFRKAKCITI